MDLERHEGVQRLKEGKDSFGGGVVYQNQIGSKTEPGGYGVKRFRPTRGSPETK